MECDSLCTGVVYTSPGMAAAELKRQNKHGVSVHLANRQSDVMKNKRSKKSAATLHTRTHCSNDSRKCNPEYANT